MINKLPINKIIHGSSIEVLSSFPDDSIDLVMFSPAYWGLRDYKVEGQLGLEPHPQLYIDNMVKVCRAIKRVLKKSGSMYIVVGDTYCSGSGSYGVDKKRGKVRRQNGLPMLPPNRNIEYDGKWLQFKQKLMIPSRLWIALQEDGWILRNKIIWYKHNPMPESCNDRYTQCYEEIGFFVKPPAKNIYFDMETILKPLKKTSLERCKRPYYDENKTGYRIGVEGHRSFAEKVKSKTVSGRHPRDVWEINTKSLHLSHIAVYPEQLCVDPIKTTPKNAVILDPMCGSGTTCLVAHKLGRRWIGIDISEEYVEIARKRLNRAGAYSKKLGEFQ